jgi:hypothetical protein
MPFLITIPIKLKKPSNATNEKAEFVLKSPKVTPTIIKGIVKIMTIPFGTELKRMIIISTIIKKLTGRLAANAF